MDRDVNLLFGVFAVQLRKVPAHHLMDVAGAWAMDPSKSIAERLVAAQALSKDDAVFIHRLVKEAVAAHHGDAAATLATLGGDEVLNATFGGSLGASHHRTLNLSDTSDTVRYLDGKSVPGVQETPGRYTQVSEYGRGGMGRVLLVHDAFLGRDVAFKELLPGPTPKNSDSPSTPVREYMSILTRFLQEARITGQLEHPSIVPVYELGHRSDGRLYYTMKLVRGKTLRQAMRECKTLTQRLTLLPHFVDLCHAIAYAHSRRIIHRDIKPDNVMVGEFGETVVLDWGLAKSKDDVDCHADGIAETIRLLHLGDVDSAAKTQYGQVMGTPAYMAPEQACGQLDAIDERSDVYSLGVVFYELLQGRPAFTGASPAQIIKNVLNDVPAPLDQTIPPELRAICTKAMHKKPQHRYAAASEIADEVRRFLSGAMVQTYAYGWKERAVRAVRRHKAVAVTAATAVVLIAAVTATSYHRVVQERDAAIVAQQEAESARADAIDSREQTEHAVYRTSLLLAHALTEKSQFDQANETLWSTPERLRNWEWGYLLNLCNRDVQTFSSKGGPLLSVSFSPDGTRIVTSGVDGFARVWDLQKGTLVQALKAGATQLTSAEFDSTGKWIMTTENQHTIQLWDSATGEKGKAFGTAMTDAVVSARFNSSGTHIAAALLSNQLAVWDVLSGDRTLLDGHRDLVYRVAFSPDGTRLASVSRDSSVKFWNAATGTLIADLAGHTKTVRDVEFSPSGDRLVTAGYDHSVRVWDTKTFKEIATLEHPAPMYAAIFDSDESHIITGGGDKIIRIWDWKTGKVIRELHGHSDTVSYLQRDPAGERTVSCSLDGNAKIWSKESYGVSLSMQHPIASARISPDGSKLLLTLDNGVFQVRNAHSGALIGSLAGFNGSSSEWSADGSRMHLHSDRGESAIVEWPNVRAIHFPNAFNTALTQYNADGSRVVAAGFMGDLTVFDSATETALTTITFPSEEVTAFRLADTGELAATGTDRGDVILWDLTKPCPTVLGRHSGRVSALAFHMGRNWLASGSEDGEVRVWDVTTGKLLHRLKSQVSTIIAMEFSPDGSRLVAGSLDRSVCLWDTASGTPHLSLTHPQYTYSALSWSRDGNRLAVGAGRDLEIWSAAPWRAAALPGSEGQPWFDRFAQLKRESPRNGMPDKAEAPLHKVVITPGNLAKALRRVQWVCEHQPEVVTTSGIDLSNEYAKGAFRYFGLDDETALVAIQDMAQAGPSGAVGQIAAVLDALRTSEARSLLFTFTGPRGDRTVHVDVVPAAVRNYRVTLPRMLGMIVLQQGVAIINPGRGTAVEYARMYSRIYDLPVLPVLEQEIDGLWVDQIFASNEKEKEIVKIVESFYKTAGIQYMDHLVALNGAEMNSLDVLLQELKKGLEAVESGQPYSFRLDIDRGRFQRVQIDIDIA